MQKGISLKPFLYQSQNNIELNKKINQKKTSLSQDKIYFFRTSLFTEKSKNIVKKMNSCQKKKIKSPIIPQQINPESRTSFALKSNNNKDNNGTSEENNNSNIKNKNEEINVNNNNISKKDVKINSINNVNFNDNKNINCSKKDISRKTSNHLINIINNNNNEKKNSIKSKTEDKKDNFNIENCQKINYKNINGIQKCRLFNSLSNLINDINKDNRNKSILRNYIGHSQSIINTRLPNANSKQKNLSQKKQLKLIDNNIKYKLKTKKVSNKDNNNKNIVTIKSIYDNNTMKKELKYCKPLSKHSKIQSIFDENYHISRYKLGNYLAKRNNRYNINEVSEDKINIKYKK